MKYILRSTLVFLLVLLQLSSPLLHAHTGDTFTVEGFHVPGLEAIAGNDNASGFTSDIPYFEIEGVIFSVASGIKGQDDWYDSTAKPFLKFDEIKPVSTQLFREHNFSPHFAIFFSRKFYHHAPPRAPPIKNL